MQLRKYQSEAIEQIEGYIALGSREICLDATVSFGKTITISHFIKDQIEEGKSVVFMMNLTALVEQTMRALDSIGVSYKVLAAEFDGQEFDHQAKVTIAMQQTLHARLEKIKLPECDVLVIDEFHRSFRTNTMEEVKKKLNPDTIVGLSGTPYDEKAYALPGVDTVQTVSTKELMDQGYLEPLKVMSVQFAEDVDLTDGGSGEYSESFLDGKLNNPSYNKCVVSSWKKVASNMKTIVFATGIAHSEALAAEFARNGIEAMAYHSKLSKKATKSVFEDFKNNKTQVLVSMSKLIVGFDMPDIECGIACRPSKTRRVVIQAMGRLIRKHPDNKPALLLDCAQWTREHGFIEEPFHSPELGDKETLNKEKERTSATEVPILMNGEEPTEVTRELVVQKIKELKTKAKRIPELDFKDLLAIYETSQSVRQIIEVGYDINRRKTGQGYQPTQIDWATELWIPFITEYPEFKSRILRSLRTRLKNIVSQGKKVAAIHYFPDWLKDQTPYKRLIVPDSVDVSEEEYNVYAEYNITEDEIPF